MKLKEIVEVLLRTPAIKGSRLELAALVARDGHADAVKEVTDFWIKSGGTVEI